MAMKITAELSGETINLEVPSDMKIKELKEKLEVLNPLEDEVARFFSTVHIVVEGEQLTDLETIVSETPLDGAHVQAGGK
eukprot:s276_g2.t1